MYRKAFVLAAFALLTSGVAHAQYVPIYGGPAYDSSTGNGYQNGGFVSGAAYSPVGSGVGIAIAQKYVAGVNEGPRGVRWDSSGTATVLDDLGTDSSGHTENYAASINSTGTIIGEGYKYTAGINKGIRALRWSSLGAVTELDNLGTDNDGYTIAEALAINSAGMSVGDAGKYVAGIGLGQRAVRWDASSTAITELGNLGTDSSGNSYSAAYSINGAGTIAGTANKYQAGTSVGVRAVRWNASGTAITELDNLGTNSDGFTNDYGVFINDAGTVFGAAYKYLAGNVYQGTRAVRWDASSTAITELGNLGTDSSGVANSQIYGISDVGTATGGATKYVAGASKGARAVRWEVDGTATELGNLGTDSSGSILNARGAAINDSGIIVGYTEAYDVLGHDLGARAVMWGQDGVAIALNTLIDPTSGWTNLDGAFDISNDDWIVGSGTFDPDGPGGLAAYRRVFLMQVPEPTSALLLALGALPLLMLRRRSVF